MSIVIEESLKVSLVILNVGIIGEALHSLVRGLDQKTSNGVNVMVDVQPNGIHRLAVEKERISVNIQPERISIDRDYPCTRRELQRLAEIAELTIANINLHLNDLVPTDLAVFTASDVADEQRTYTFGFNFRACCRYESDKQIDGFPIDRYLNTSKLNADGFRSLDGNWELRFVGDGKTWQLGVKPFPGVHDGTLFLVNLNCHFENQLLPRDRDAINETFQEVWNRATMFVNSMEVST